MPIESVMPLNYLILCCPLLLLPPIFPSIRVFSNESALCTKWPKYWNFNFSISPYNEYSRLISFRIDCLDHLAVQGILKSLLQHHNWEASVALQNVWLGSFMAQFSNFFCLFDVDLFFFKSLLNLLYYCFCFMFQFFGLEAYGILNPQRSNPHPPN